VIVHQLGAYETALALMLEFFPDGDTSQEPQVTGPSHKRWILNAVGFRLMSLGRLGEAASFYERSNAIALGMEDWHNTSIGYQNLAGLHAYLGTLTTSVDAASEAVALARHTENKRDDCKALAHQAWATHLSGDLEAAGAAFRQAETLEREINPNVRYLYATKGIQHADHLRRMGDADYARRATEANVEICEDGHYVVDLGRCYRTLGDLDADAGQHESAREHYDEALKIARVISVRHALIEALLARGRWAARRGDVAAARIDLDEALDYAIAGGYRICEADIRVGQAWAHRAAGDAEAAHAEAARARQMSVEMGYHWGQVDANEVLAAIEPPDDPRVQ